MFGSGVWLLAVALGACGARTSLELDLVDDGGSTSVADGGRSSSGSAGRAFGGTLGGGSGPASPGGAMNGGAPVAGGSDGGAVNGGSAGAGDAGSPAAPPITDIAAHGERTCARFADGSIECWGSNFDGQLGYGNRLDVSVPASVGAVSVSRGRSPTVSKLGGGRPQNCVVLSDGSAKCWGSNEYAQLGAGNLLAIGDDELPASVGPISITTRPHVFVTSVVGGDLHTCALLSDGSVSCWGSGCCNGHDRPVTGSDLPSSVGPVILVDTPGITTLALAADGSHTCALLSDGSLTCWGRSDFGELGYGNTAAIGYGVEPVAAGRVSVTSTPGRVVTQVAAGYAHTCALLSDGSLKCWGWNLSGQLGSGDHQNIGDDELPASALDIRVTTTAGVTVKQVAAGGRHTCALLSDDTVKCWGDNSYGQLGYGNTHLGDQSPSLLPPVSITTLPGVRVEQLSLGDYHSCARLSDGSAKCWGMNHDGQLGTGDTSNVGDDELPSSLGPIVTH